MTPAPLLILLCGPPGSGKDTGAAYLCAQIPGLIRQGFADELKRRTHAVYGLDPDPYDRFEAVKDKHRAEFFGLTPRQAYINVSENLFKPAHGADVFGKLYVQGMRRWHGATAFVAPDSGFAAEAGPVLDKVGRDNAILLRIHAARRGRTFDGDSRSYIELPGVETHDLENEDEGDPAPYLTDLGAVVGPWLMKRLAARR